MFEEQMQQQVQYLYNSIRRLVQIEWHPTYETRQLKVQPWCISWVWRESNIKTYQVGGSKDSYASGQIQTLVIADMLWYATHLNAIRDEVWLTSLQITCTASSRRRFKNQLIT